MDITRLLPRRERYQDHGRGAPVTEVSYTQDSLGGRSSDDPFESMAIHLIKGKKKDLESNDTERRRSALRWVFASHGGTLSARWCCGKIGESIQALRRFAREVAPELVSSEG